MSGPGLTHHDTHHAIHQAAFAEAEQLTRLLRERATRANGGKEDEMLELADILVEHWKTRTLAHAEAEEDGLYKEIVRQDPSKFPEIQQLVRDHTLLRSLLFEIEGILAVRGWSTGIVERFEAMLLVNSIHSRDEESFLFS